MSARLLHSAAISHQLAGVIAQHLAAANILGRTQIVREVARTTGRKVALSTFSRKPVPRQFAESEDDGEEDDAALDLSSRAVDATVGFSLNLPGGSPSAEYIRQLTPVTRETFDGLTQQYRKDSFTVAGVSDVRLIARIRDELAAVAQRGGTQRDFEKAVAKLETDAGVEQLSAFTLDTVFMTNMAKAYSLGRYEQMRHPDVMAALPFWQYMTVGDDRVRPEHAVLDYFVARASDPVWNKIYPPNGFNCRCIVVPILESQALLRNKDAGDPGYMRLPLLARLKVPQAGFAKVFRVSA